VAWLVFAVGVVATGNGLNTPSLSSLISRAAGGDRQGGVLGVAQSCGALARIGGPMLGYSLFAFGEAVPYLAAAAIIGAAFVLASLGVQQPHEAASAQAPALEP
jgi:hypothetical protein